MIVFKTFCKVLKANLVPIILYTAILIFFGAFNMSTSDSNQMFIASKPDIYIENKDEEKGITKALIDYMSNTCNIIDLKEEKEALDDALFYRDINYLIIIPENFQTDFQNGLNPEIEIKSTGDYQASLAEMMLTRFLKVAKTYQKNSNQEEEMLKQIKETLEHETALEMTTKRDTETLSKATSFYNFANYSILAGCVYVICLIISSFKALPIQKRTIISSMDYKKQNRYLLLANSLFALVLWGFYIILSILLIGSSMFSSYGLMYMANSLLFTICAVTIAFLISNIISNKNALNGIINVIALGSSFLCGAFVPLEWLPDSIIKIAHILPSYYYISNNEFISSLENFQWSSLKPIFTNGILIIIFTIVFILLANWISKRKRKVG